jgi:hypothetical protein
MSIEENKKAIYRYIKLFNECTLEWVDMCYSKELFWKKHPTLSFPHGRSGDFNVFRNAASRVLKIFPDRSLLVNKCVAEGDNVAIGQSWKAVVAVTGGNYKTGDRVDMEIASFFKLKNGLIIEQIDYPMTII